MYDVEMMKKKAAKEALEDLIEQIMGMEGNIDGEEEMPSMKHEMDEMKSSGEEKSPMMEESDMDEADMEDKQMYMTGKKKPVMKKSMTIMIGSGGSKSPMKQMMKKLKNG